jgi:protein-S-isoprenylcysteine O-methyltransferase Ste14
MKSSRGYVLVLIQVITGIFLILTTRWNTLSVWSILAVAISVILLTWSVIAIRTGNFNIHPTPVINGQLTTRGPYRLIRHPMYSSVLLASVTLIAEQFSLLRLGCGIILLADLLIKLKYEEKLLLLQYPDYESYCRLTKRLIPFII